MNNIQNVGEIAALLTAVSWTITGLCFQWAGKRIGALSLNLTRLLFAMGAITLYSFFSRGYLLPTDASAHAWLWLSISGLIGFVLGDYFLFSAYTFIGARVALLIFSSSPIITGIFSYFLFDEALSKWSILGILLVISGIGMVILADKPQAKGLSLRFEPKGILYAFIAAVGQALGIITSKLGMGSYNAVSATQIRIIAGIIGFSIVFFIAGHWKKYGHSWKDGPAMRVSFLGAMFGPFIGVSLSLYAIQHAQTAVASTIMSTMPILIIPASILIFHEKVRAREILGALVAILGTAILFLMN